MSIIPNVNDLLDAAHTLAEAGTLPDAERQAFESALLAVVAPFAQRLADVEGVTLSDVSHQGGFGGLCATFRPGPDGKTSDALAAGDEGGDWD